MDLVDALLELYQIDPTRIPVWRPEIDRIDLYGKILLSRGDFRRGIKKKIIGAVGYYRTEEYFEAAHSFEWATKAARNFEVPAKRVVLAELCAVSYRKAQELHQSPKKKSSPQEDLAWALSRQADAYVDLIRQRERAGEDLSELYGKADTAAKRAIELFRLTGIDPFKDLRTSGLYEKLAQYLEI